MTGPEAAAVTTAICAGLVATWAVALGAWVDWRRRVHRRADP